MKGDVGMSVHEKEGNKKMPRLRQEIIDNPIPTSLFMCYAAVLLFVGTGDAILRTLVNVYLNHWKTKMVVALVNFADKATIVWYVKANSISTYYTYNAQ